MAFIVVENHSGEPIDVFVSSYGEPGDDNWFHFGINDGRIFPRKRWQVVGFMNAADQRAAIYVKPDVNVRFFSMNNIQVA